MDKYNISKIDLFSFDLKRGELCNIHSLLLFIYSKFNGDPQISFKYSEILWMNYNLVLKTLNKINDLELIKIIERPTRQTPMTIQIKTNEELQYILNKNKKIEFEKYKYKKFTEDDLKEIIGGTLAANFDIKQVPSWIRNINSGIWDKNKFLIISKIVSHFICDYRIKSATINKYITQNTFFYKNISFLYDRIPNNRKEIIYRQFENTLRVLEKSHDGSFIDMVKKYLEEIS